VGFEETLRRAEIAMMGVDAFKRQFNISDSLSLDKEASKRVMIYYAAPKPHRYGFFTSTNPSAREAYFTDIVSNYSKQTKNLIWC